MTSCRMAYFRNNGTATNPSFELMTHDFDLDKPLGSIVLPRHLVIWIQMVI